MAHLNLTELAGLGARANGHLQSYLKFSKGARRGRRVTRPSVGPARLSGLGATSECGPEPATAPGEQKTCCPGVGWVIYDAGDSSYGICERAKAQSSGSGGSSSSGDAGPLPSDPLERVEEMRRRLDARRDAQEEARFERMKQEVKLRFVASQIQAVKARESAREQAELAAAAARRAAKRKIEAERIRSERNKKILIGGAVALVAAKALRFI